MISHLNIAKCIIKYISGICEYGIWYFSDFNTSILAFLCVLGMKHGGKEEHIGGCFCAYYSMQQEIEQSIVVYSWYQEHCFKYVLHAVALNEADGEWLWNWTTCDDYLL